MSKLVKFLSVAVLACTLNAWCSCAEIEADIVSIHSPNLLVNPGFEDVDATGTPVGWVFANMANSNKISAGVRNEDAIGKYSAFVVISGNLPGYWVQAKPVPVVENGKNGRELKRSFQKILRGESHPMDTKSMDPILRRVQGISISYLDSLSGSAASGAGKSVLYSAYRDDLNHGGFSL